MYFCKKIVSTFCASVLLAACGSGGEDTNGPVDDDLTTSKVSSFTIQQSAGFTAPGANCRTSGFWTIDLVNKTITGAGCVEARRTTVSRTLTNTEVGEARMALAKVRTAPRPESCPTDAQVLSLDVVRNGTQYRYVQERSACSSGTPVTSETIAALYQKAVELIPPRN
ncbi:MAG: hypothetical protein HOO96_31485 [Polyangiaceae bacterium]|nr:hypothetical protein [Polyangiaceae bacterium]